jgi:hypothetical protein
MELSEFLLARITEDEEDNDQLVRDEAARCQADGMPGMTETDVRAYWGAQAWWRRRLAEPEAKRQIVELHKSWPVLVEGPPEMTKADSLSDMTFRLTRQIAWLTQEEYRKRFGDEPPTTPMLRALAAVYADHPDYREEWKP